MDLSVIIVSWNVKEKLRENLNSLKKSEGNLSFEVFVVDNNSTDGTIEMIKNDFPEIKLIANKDNLGFSKANNQAIKVATGKYILLLNPDMRVMPDTLIKMFNWFDENKQAKVASCKLINQHGELIYHVRRFPTITDQLAIVTKVGHLKKTVLDKYLFKDFNYEKAASVDSVRGSFFMLRRPENSLPLLDESYFIWFEEVDYCKQIKENGGEVWYTPEAMAIDFVGASFSQVKKTKTQDYFKKSMLVYFKKWHPYWQYLLLKIFWPIGKFLAVFADKINLKSRQKT